MTEQLIYPNGIDAETGEPLLPAMPAALVAELAKGNPISIEELKELQARQRILTGEADYGVMANIDSNDLAQTGWGVIFAFEDRDRAPPSGRRSPPCWICGEARPVRSTGTRPSIPSSSAGRAKRAAVGWPATAARPASPSIRGRPPTTCSSSATRRRSPTASSTSST